MAENEPVINHWAPGVGKDGKAPTGAEGTRMPGAETEIPAANSKEQLNLLRNEVGAPEEALNAYSAEVDRLATAIEAGNMTLQEAQQALNLTTGTLETAAGGPTVATQRLCEATDTYLASLVEKAE